MQVSRSLRDPDRNHWKLVPRHGGAGVVGESSAWLYRVLGVASLPASVDTVIAYVSELPTMPNSARHGRGMRKTSKIGYSVSTIERRMATISARHKEEGLESPCGHPHVH